jgi:hypothetical protein
MIERLVEFVYPDLLDVPPEDRPKLLRQARDGEYDKIEWLGLAFAITSTVLLTRSVADLSWANRVTALLTNFFVAVPLLLVMAGPFAIRRTKRHLRRLLNKGSDSRKGSE